MSAVGDILSVRLRNRAALLRMMAAGEWVMSARELRREVRAVAADLERDAERVMSLEVRKGGSV